MLCYIPPLYVVYVVYIQKLSLTAQFQNPNIFYIYSYIFSEYYCYQTKHQPSPLLHCPCGTTAPVTSVMYLEL